MFCGTSCCLAEGHSSTYSKAAGEAGRRTEKGKPCFSWWFLSKTRQSNSRRGPWYVRMYTLTFFLIPEVFKRNPHPVPWCLRMYKLTFFVIPEVATPTRNPTF